jgi:hypothetical protein
MTDDMMRCERCFGRGYTSVFAELGGLKFETCRKCRGNGQYPHPKPAPSSQTFRHGTWVQTENVISPRGKTGRKFRAIYVDKENVQRWVKGTAGRPDTFFSIPARAKDLSSVPLDGFLHIENDTLMFRLNIIQMEE